MNLSILWLPKFSISLSGNDESTTDVLLSVPLSVVCELSHSSRTVYIIRNNTNAMTIPDDCDVLLKPAGASE